MDTVRTARQRVRDEITAEIVAAGRRQLAESGPTGLSLRAVARDVGMVSSAVYRYFPSRDELLTALLVTAYDELGAAAEAADDAVTGADGGDPAARWTAVCRGVRAWALEHPHEWALLYGSPVSGYAAPPDTVTPAARVVVRLASAVVAAHDAGAPSPEPPDGAADGFTDAVRPAAAALADLVDLESDVSLELVGRTVMAWSSIVGVISFELWGHLVGSVDDHDAYFAGVATRTWQGLFAPSADSGPGA